MSPIDPAHWASMCAYGRRRFLRSAFAAAAATVSTLTAAPRLLAAAAVDGDEGEGEVLPKPTRVPPPPAFSPTVRANARVSLVRCRSFGAAIHAAMGEAFDLLGGIGGLVRGKTVTVKLNLTGSAFEPVLGRPVGESFITHPDSAMALAAHLFKAGATRVRFVESTQRVQALEATVADAGWDVKAFEGLGRVEWENTRNLGRGRAYAGLKVASGGYLFSGFEVNRAYLDTDALVSLCKLKEHLTCGVTAAVKNLFGIVPNSLYGDEAPNERATAGRGPLHNRSAYRGTGLMPGELKVDLADSAFLRVPRIVADILEARPVELSVIDAVSSMKGGEGPWAGKVGWIAPGVLMAGLNPVSADAIGTVVMGFPNPRAGRGVAPFETCDNHLLLAEQRGLGVLDPAGIEVRGLPVAEAVHPYRGRA